MKTPIFIHKEKISNEPVKEVINYFKKNKKFLFEGKIGAGRIDPSIKKSKDIGIAPNELDKKLPKYVRDLKKVIQNYIFKYTEIEGFNLNIFETINIQYYKALEGFYKPHCEKASLSSSPRVLVFMTYLTDNPEGGTYFKYQDWICPATKGDTLIWPADWTFIHNGIVDFNNDKMIITGWLSLSK